MTRIFENQELERFYDRDSGRIFEDLEFRRCSFSNCALSITFNPQLRSTVRHVKIVRCKAYSCSLRTTILEDVLVQGLETDYFSSSMGAVFKHVTLQGKIGPLRIRSYVGDTSPANQKAFDEANVAYYASVDWALDIREAEFKELDLQGVPAHLVRRDPATQIIVTREKALEGRWQTLDLSETYWPTALNDLIAGNDPDVVLAAPKRDRKYARLLEGLQILREAGVAEPN